MDVDLPSTIVFLCVDDETFVGDYSGVGCCGPGAGGKSDR
jgi:hypothetical protein